MYIIVTDAFDQPYGTWLDYESARRWATARQLKQFRIVQVRRVS